MRVPSRGWRRLLRLRQSNPPGTTSVSRRLEKGRAAALTHPACRTALHNTVRIRLGRGEHRLRDYVTSRAMARLRRQANCVRLPACQHAGSDHARAKCRPWAGRWCSRQRSPSFCASTSILAAFLPRYTSSPEDFYSSRADAAVHVRSFPAGNAPLARIPGTTYCFSSPPSRAILLMRTSPGV